MRHTSGGTRAGSTPLLPSAARIVDLSIGQMLWSRRTVFMALIVAGPVVIAGVVRLVTALGWPLEAGVTGPGAFGLMIWVFYLRFTVPVLGVFYGTSLIADEVDDKTITYLFTRPIPRGAVLVGKYLAYLVVTACVVLPSVVVDYLLIVPIRGSLGESFLPALTDLGLIAVGLAVYGALFAYVGAQFKRPLLVGLVVIFGWEQAALALPGYLKRFTVAYYLQALVPHAMPEDSTLSLVQAIFRETPGVGVSLAWLFLIGVTALLLAAWTVERREYVLEQ